MNVSEYRAYTRLIYLAHQGWSEEKKARLIEECALIIGEPVRQLIFWPDRLEDANLSDPVVPGPWIVSPKARYRWSKEPVVHLIEPRVNHVGVLYIETEKNRFVVCVAPEERDDSPAIPEESELMNCIRSAGIFLAYGRACRVSQALMNEKQQCIGFDPRLDGAPKAGFRQYVFVRNSHNTIYPNATTFLPMPYFNIAYTVRGANKTSNDALPVLYGKDVCLQHSHPLSLFMVACSGKSSAYEMNMKFLVDTEFNTLKELYTFVDFSQPTAPRKLSAASDLQLYCYVRDTFYKKFQKNVEPSLEVKVAFVYHALRHRPPVLQNTEALLKAACHQGHQMRRGNEPFDEEGTWSMSIHFALSVFTEASKPFFKRRSTLRELYEQSPPEFKEECQLADLKKHIALPSS